MEEKQAAEERARLVEQETELARLELMEKNAR